MKWALTRYQASLLRQASTLVVMSALAVSNLQAADSKIKLSTSGPVKDVRYVRIELSKKKNGILTLAEVEVRSGGKNIANKGKAKQSSTAAGGDASRAIDGNKNPQFLLNGNPTQSHTSHGEGNWWELDLGKSYSIDEIEIWNREEKYADRLNGFTLQLLNEKRKQVFAQRQVAAPKGSVAFAFSKASSVLYRDYGGGEGSPMAYLREREIRKVKVPAGFRDPQPFRFKKGDTISIMGNGLVDRMQHAGWVEALLQRESVGQELSFRNMGVSGDRANNYPRNKGFTPMDEYLQQVQADVIFAFFGYNESFGKKDKVGAFEEDLKSMVSSIRAAQPNGKSFPRIVLFSPIAHENLNDPNLPDGVENNENLALYTEAMKKIAEEVGVTFVDLFQPTQKLYEQSEAPLTMNGIHLNDEGYRQLAGVIAGEIFQKESQAERDDAKLAAIKEAILDKNWHWHNRYRATDGNDIWGGRSTLSFIDKQTNAEVLQHELIMLDQMTKNRDHKIWAQVKGESYKVDDSNVPPAIVVKSNVGSKERNSEKEGNSSYKSPEESIKTLKVTEGFQLNIFADEGRFPELANPVQMQVDGQGRLWAAVWKTYPKWEPLKAMDDALLIFHDDDNDGRADRTTEFAKVHNPVGFEFWNGGVIVSSQPDLIFLKDTDGDDVADVREVILSGIGSADTHHAANNLHYGPDGAIYWESGVFLVNNIEHPWGASYKTGSSGVYRFDPRRYTVSFHAGGYSPNPHGTCFNFWGYHFAQDGTGGRAVQIRRDKNGFDSFPLIDREVRPVTSSAIVSSANFPDEMQQNYLLSNVIGFLGLKHYKLHLEGFPEKDYGFGEVWGTKEPEPLQSDDRNFRPTDMKFGPDGSLYISDWQNVIIGHMQHNIRDPKRDKKHGRIYRMVYTGKPLQKPVKIDGESLESLVKNLEHPIDGVRHRTRVELSERPTDEVISAVREWVSGFDPKKKEDAHHLLEALWVHQQHNVRDELLLEKLLNSPEPHAVEAAKTVKHYWTVADVAQYRERKIVVEEHNKKLKINVPKHFNVGEAERYRLGAEIYRREAHCSTCHQEDGAGLGEIYPPLKNSRWVTEDPERLIKLSLHGIWGEIEVDGKVYDPSKGVPPMVAFHSILDDMELASVLTYVRHTWGNEAAPINDDLVKKVRQATKDREKFYQVEELLKEHPMDKKK